MKYYVVVQPGRSHDDLTRQMVIDRLNKRSEWRVLGYTIEWAEAFDAWVAEFDTPEEAALFKLTHT